jgi:hypothetical protein
VDRPIEATDQDVPELKRDLREFADQTNVRLLAGAFLLLFGVGVLLIFLIYGAGAAVAAFLCLLMGLIPIGLILAWLLGMDWIVKRARPK